MALVMMLPTVVSAQRGIPRSNNVSVSSTVVTKSAKVSDCQGFQQMIGLQAGYAFEIEGAALGISYVGGYRFNEWFYLGCGAGFMSDAGGDDYGIPLYATTRGYFSNNRIKPYASVSLGTIFGDFVDFPLYADFTLGVEIPVYMKLSVPIGIGVNTSGVYFKTGLSF